MQTDTDTETATAVDNNSTALAARNERNRIQPT
jgi:hypothetical protein